MSKPWSGERLEPFVFNETAIEHLHRYAAAVELAKNKDVLDVACGEGYGAKLIAGTALSVTGIDNDASTVKEAVRKYAGGNLRFLHGDALNIPADASLFDMAVSFETIEHLAHHDQFLKEIKRVLRKDGMLLISTPNKKTYSDIPGYSNPFHVKELYENELESLLNKYFTNVRIFYQQCTFASVIVSDAGTAGPLFHGNYSEVSAAPVFTAVYLVALASDAPVAADISGVFLGNQIFQQALKEKEAAVKHTLSYRIGHFILLPIKLLRNLLK